MAFSEQCHLWFYWGVFWSNGAFVWKHLINYKKNFRGVYTSGLVWSLPHSETNFAITVLWFALHLWRQCLPLNTSSLSPPSTEKSRGRCLFFFLSVSLLPSFLNAVFFLLSVFPLSPHKLTSQVAPNVDLATTYSVDGVVGLKRIHAQFQ